jgi:hypothetical protein
MHTEQQASESWRPPPWLPLGFTTIFGLMLLGALILGANWHATSVVAALFALCFRTTFRGLTAYSRE